MSVTEVGYDPYDYGIDADAPAVWRRLRDEAPLYRNDEYDFFALSRYDDVLGGLVDTDLFRSGHGTVLEMMTDEPFPAPMMLMRDPPEHTRLREVVSRAFTPRTMAGLETRIESVCGEYLDRQIGESSFDYVDDFAALVPPTVILALLGFPEGFARAWREEMDASLHVDDPSTDSSGPGDPSRGLDAVLSGQLDDLVARRRAEPTDDLVSVLAHTDLEQPDGSRRPLTHDELNAYVLLIAGAGAETVARLLGWAAVLLARHPDQRDLLVADPGLIPNAIEEILRYEAPSPVQARRVSRDVTYHDQLVPAGSNLLLLNGSANRDERHFGDPDHFDVQRHIDRHLAFGYGAHFCLGAALARMEGRIALEATLARFPRWEIDEAELEWVHTSTVRGYHRVPIHVG